MLLMPMVIISTQMKNSKRKISKQYKCKGPKDTSLTKTTAHDARNEHNHFTIPRGIYVLSSASAFRFFFLSPRTEFINWCVWWKCSSGQGDECFQLLNGKKILRTHSCCCCCWCWWNEIFYKKIYWLICDERSHNKSRKQQYLYIFS